MLHALIDYEAFGLRLRSALPLPELRKARLDQADASDTVTILPGPVPRPEGPLRLETDRECAAPGIYWLDVPGIARLSATDGSEIWVEAHPAATPADVRAFLLGSAAGALLHQRALLPLHASAVAIGGRAVVFVAPSGGGKSTMAMDLGRSGCPILCDDLSAIDFAGGSPRLWPGLRNLKLWRTSLAMAGRTPNGLEPVVVGADKYRLPIALPGDYRPHGLSAVIVLEWGEKVDLTVLGGAEAATALISNTFRGHLVAPLRRSAEHWRQCLGLAAAVPVYRLRRPRNAATLRDATAVVLAALGHEGG